MLFRGDKEAVDVLLEHPDVKAVSFVVQPQLPIMSIKQQQPMANAFNVVVEQKIMRL